VATEGARGKSGGSGCPNRHQIVDTGAAFERALFIDCSRRKTVLRPKPGGSQSGPYRITRRRTESDSRKTTPRRNWPGRECCAGAPSRMTVMNPMTTLMGGVQSEAFWGQTKSAAPQLVQYPCLNFNRLPAPSPGPRNQAHLHPDRAPTQQQQRTHFKPKDSKARPKQSSNPAP